MLWISTEKLTKIIENLRDSLALKNHKHTKEDITDFPTLSKVATSGSYNDLSDKPPIGSVVTEQTISDWGFTKNTGNYNKPSDGIPKTDLESSVQTSLGKADTAIQSHQDISGKAEASEVGYSLNVNGRKVSLLNKDGEEISSVNTQDNNTWNANAKDVAGYVAAPGDNANKVWKTDAEGNPGWRDESATVYLPATPTSNGLMSSSDKSKLDEYGSVLSTLEEVEANTDSKNVASANALKEGLGGLKFGIDGDGNRGYYKADGSFNPFKSGLKFLATVTSTLSNPELTAYSTTITVPQGTTLDNIFPVVKSVLTQCVSYGSSRGEYNTTALKPTLELNGTSLKVTFPRHIILKTSSSTGGRGNMAIKECDFYLI